jgi:hypothetical protein
MPKLIPSALQTDIQKNVTTTVVCIEITRIDRQIVRITNHDQDLVVDGRTYFHNVAFIMEAIQSGSSLSVDNTDITLACDENLFSLQDFKRGAYDKANISIYLVDYTAPGDGVLTLRAGWIGQIVPRQNGNVTMTVIGLLKILDFEVGRRYQPSCDADLGDRRCKVAIDPSQAWHPANSYKQGEWFYHYNVADMTAITLVNPGFEADGSVSEGNPITGWTQSPDGNFIVSTTRGGLDNYLGTYSLYGGDDNHNDLTESYVYQDIDLVAAGLVAADIDDGKISFFMQVALGQDTYLLDKPRLAIEVFDAAGNTIDSRDTGYFELDTFGEWRGKSVALPLIEGARTVRMYLHMRKTDGEVVNVAYDDVKAFWYDHTLGNPYFDVIHNVRRLIEVEPANESRIIRNPGFEQGQAPIANSNVTAIPGWTRPNGTSDWWQVASAPMLLLGPTDGTYMLQAGDDGSATQKTYQLRQVLSLVNDLKLTLARVALGAYVGRFSIDVLFGTNFDDATVVLDFYDAGAALVGTTTVRAAGLPVGAPVGLAYSEFFVIPVDATSMHITLSATSGVGTSIPYVAFDNLRMFILDGLRPVKNDLLTGYGDDDDEFAQAAGEFTWTDNLVLRAHTAHRAFDLVDSVTSLKEFQGTNITGATGTYETGIMRWISGANAGQSNLIRTWDPDTKSIKLYFACLNPIQIGDRFEYIRSCQKRFETDCQLVFDNVINFRGFPHLPGKLT